MKLLGSAIIKINKDENGENVLPSEITEVTLIDFKTVNNDYQQDSRGFYTFIPIKQLGQLLDISPKNFILLKAFIAEFSSIEVWFTDLLNCQRQKIK